VGSCGTRGEERGAGSPGVRREVSGGGGGADAGPGRGSTSEGVVGDEFRSATMGLFGKFETVKENLLGAPSVRTVIEYETISTLQPQYVGVFCLRRSSF
jgi:hypothetical protein